MRVQSLRSRAALVLLAAALLCSCNRSSTGKTAAGAARGEPDALKVGVLPFLSNSILEIGVREGFFADQGIAVELVKVASVNDIAPLLVQGVIDISTPGLTAGLFNSISNGAQIRLVLALTDFAVQDCASIAFVARRADVESGKYADPARWKGARMALSTPGAPGVPSFVLSKVLASVGLTSADVKVMGIDLAVQGEALRTGQLDIVYAIEPWITRMCAPGDIAVLMPVEPVAPEMTASVIVYGQKPLKNRDLGRRFAVAYLRAVRQYRLGKTDRNVEIASEYTGLEPELVRRICWSSSPADGRINADSVMAYQSWLAGLGALDRIVAPKEFLDGEFADYAARELAKAQR